MPLKVAPMCSKAHSFDHPEYFLFETEVDSAFFNQREGGFLSTAVSAFILTQQATVYVVYVSVSLTSRQLSAQLSSPPLSVTFSQYNIRV